MTLYSHAELPQCNIATDCAEGTEQLHTVGSSAEDNFKEYLGLVKCIIHMSTCSLRSTQR